MRKHKIFNPLFYLDALRQLRLPTLIFGITALVISLLPPLFDIFDKGGTTIYEANLLGVTPVLFFYMFVGGIGLVMYAFSYQNKRSSSDFYHAMPNTSLCTTLSFSLAIFTCLALTVVATVLITAFFWNLAGCPLEGSEIAQLIVYFLTGSVLCASVSMVARSLTGTALTHLLASAIILLFPRFILSMVGAAVMEKTSIIPQSELGIFLNSGYNIPASLNPLLLMFNDSGAPAAYGEITFAPAYLYTLILSVIYFGLSLLLCRIRRSECAGFAALSRPVQHLFRCICILPILFIVPLNAAMENRGLWDFVGRAFPMVFVVVVIAAVIYCLYEIITTRSAKSMLRALPLFLALTIVAPPIFSGVATLQANAIESDIPKRSSVSAVRFDSLTDPIYAHDHLHNNFASAVYDGRIKFTDPEMIDICVSALEETVKRRDSFYRFRLTITYVCGRRSITRNVYFTQNELLRISDIAMTHKDYVEKLLTIPHPANIESLSDETVKFSGTVLNEIYSLFYDEFSLAALDPKLPRIATLYGSARHDGKSYRFTSYLNSATPHTLGRYIEEVNKQSELDLAEIIEEAHKLSNGNGYVSVEIYPESYAQKYFLYGDGDHVKEDSEVFDLLEAAYIDQKVDPTLPIARIHYDLAPASGFLITNINWPLS